MAALPAIELSAASVFAGQDVPPALLTEAAPADNWASQLAAGSLWVVEADGRPVAFLAASASGDRLHIDEVDVARAFQGKGIGRRLLSAAADWARAKGYGSLSLTTFRSIPWNGPFYARFGFREWTDPPASVRQALLYEAARGLKDRWAMRMDL